MTRKQNIEIKSTEKRYLEIRNDINEIYECIEHVCDDRIQDNGVLEITIYDMRHNMLMRKTFCESMTKQRSLFVANCPNRINQRLDFLLTNE